MATKTRDAGVPPGLRPGAVPGVRGDGGRGDPDHVRGHASRAARLPWRGAVRGDVGDPGWLQAPGRDVGRGGEAGAGRGDRCRRREPADPVRRLRRSRARPSNERRDGRVSRRAARRGGGRRRLRRRSRRPAPGVRRAQRKDRPGVRSPADRARRDRARPRRARGHGRRNGVRRTDVHPGRAAGGVRGRLGRAARRARTSGAASSRRTAGSSPPGAERGPGPPAAGPRSSTAQGGRGTTADRSIASSEPTRGNEPDESSCPRQVRASGRSATRGRRAACARGRRSPRQDPRDDGQPVRTAAGAAPSRS